MAPNFSDSESDDSDEVPNISTKPKHVIRKKMKRSVSVSSEDHDDENMKNEDDSRVSKSDDDDDDMLDQIMKKYSKENTQDVNKSRSTVTNDILAGLESSVSGSDDENGYNEASLEESSDIVTRLDDAAMVSLVIKEEKTDPTVPVIESVSSQNMTEMFIKPEELVSTFNPNLEKIFPKPTLPIDLMIAIAVKNIDPKQEIGATLDEVVNFVALHFPYFNRNIEECKDLIMSMQDSVLEKKTDKYYLDLHLLPSLLIRMRSIMEKIEEQVKDSMLIPNFLPTLLEKFEQGLQCEAVNFRPPYSCKMLSYLAFISLCPPVSITQLMLFLKFLFPSLIGSNTFDADDLEEWIQNDEHVQEIITADGSKMYLLNEGVYPDVLHQVTQFFATKSNYTRLKKSIYHENFISYLLPNLNQSTIRNNL